MTAIDPAKKRRALFGLLWLLFCLAAMAVAMVWTDRKHPTGWSRPDPAAEKARELLERNHEENIRPHVSR
jgi:hypothetical protein